MNIVIMVPLVSFLAALRILTEAQICNNGEGKIVYEKSISTIDEFYNSNITSHEIIIRNSVPFKVLEECFRRCQEDRLTKIPKCTKFDFLPGNRITDVEKLSDTATLPTTASIDYEPSKCVFYSEPNDYVDLRQISENQGSAWHFNEICMPAQHINRNCPNRLYVFGKVPNRKLVDPDSKELNTSNKEDCENKCLTESDFICRSASFSAKMSKCYLSQMNRYVSQNHFKEDADFEYMENMCLKHDQLCKWNVFIVENGNQLDASYEKFFVTASSINNCSNICQASLDKYGFLCRSFMFDEDNQKCILYDEDPLEISNSNKETGLKWTSSPGKLYRVLCSTDDKDKELDNKTLECYRHKRLRGKHQMEVSSTSFYECLSSCFQTLGKKCRSIEYSHLRQICRFSGRSVVGPLSKEDNDEALIDDDSFDYYQFMWNDEPEPTQPDRLYSQPTQSLYSQPTQPDRLYSQPTQSLYSQPTQPDKHISQVQLSDRHDSIEVSHSQPAGAYGNFLSPSQQPRDHHRGGFAYNIPQSHQTKIPNHSMNPESTSNKPIKTGYNTPPRYNPGFSNPSMIPRTPMIANGMNTRFMTYGIPPYAPFNQNTKQQPNYHISMPQTAIPSGSSVSSHVSYDRFSQSAQSEASIQSPGCKYDSNAIDTTKFKRVGFSARLKSKHVYKVVRAERLEDCEKFCIETKDFVCKSFNFRAFFPDNCELSSIDTKKFKLENIEHFEHNTQFDYYERIERKALMAPNAMDCFEVLQSCSPEGMEFKLKTTEEFVGRIYTYGFYESCYFDGNGGTTSVLRISKPNGFPRCGTQQIGDAMTNIVVVQFNDYVQTSRDRKYNLTCFISGPGEAVVTSNYLDTKTDGRHPMQIEHLPAQNILTSNIVLRILYRGTPTNTIVVGDLLTFRLEARNQFRSSAYHNDIFATNVIAKDPYTGRQVLLIDSRGCPVDLFVFPELHKTPDGALEAEFYAFKIPDSNFLVFQATVKTCKGACEPVICTDRSRGQGSFPSWGRRKRAIKSNKSKSQRRNGTKSEEEEVHELLRVYLSPEEVPDPEKVERPNLLIDSGKVCTDKFVYYTMVLMSAMFVIVFMILLPYCGLVRLMKLKYKNKSSMLNHWDLKWPSQMPTFAMQRSFSPSSYFGTIHTPPRLNPINEPIYSDPSIMERSRSLQSLTVQDANRIF